MKCRKGIPVELGVLDFGFRSDQVPYCRWLQNTLSNGINGQEDSFEKKIRFKNTQPLSVNFLAVSRKLASFKETSIKTKANTLKNKATGYRYDPPDRSGDLLGSVGHQGCTFELIGLPYMFDDGLRDIICF